MKKLELVQCSECVCWTETGAFAPFGTGGVCRLLPCSEFKSSVEGCFSGCKKPATEPVADTLPFPGVLASHPDVKVA